MKKNNISLEDAKIGYKNFSGAEGNFNPKGRRNFCVFLESELGERLQQDGWNVKWGTPKEEGDDPLPYIQVAVQYKNVPPRIVLISQTQSGDILGKTLLDETSVNILDWADIRNVDLIITPYDWEVGGKNGVKAYVKSMYVTIAVDDFESKYNNVPDSAASSVRNFDAD